MSLPNWRRVTSEIREKFVEHVASALQKRGDEGERKYQSSKKGFQGDPLEHLEEELLDALFYLWYAKRQREGNWKAVGRPDILRRVPDGES